MKKLIYLFISLFLFLGLNAETIHEKYFENTDYELNVYYIHGKNPGKTLMIIGGIQGDEAGGYLSADLYVDTKLEQGNLIIVPRANLPSILNNKRQISKDMNRRFDEEKSNIYEDEVVIILKSLIQKSDILLNLHEGGGYFRETWENKTHNPMKFGQCIIADADSFYFEKNNETIQLEKIAKAICFEANKHITEKEYTFRFNNHNTVSSNTKHIEQRKSATYYSLTQVGIPAFGVEVSKQLPSLGLKVKHHTIVLNEFLKYLDIIPEYPSIFLEDPDYEFAVFMVNGEKRIVEKGKTLYIPADAELEISDIKGNYPRGYLADIEGVGTTNDQGKSFKISNSTQVLIRKDSFSLNKIPIVIGEAIVPETYQGLELLVNNQKFILNPGQDLEIEKNSIIKIQGVLNKSIQLETNFLGYANPKSSADDKGYLIKIDNKLIKRFSPDNGNTWIIDVLKDKKTFAQHKLIIKQNIDKKAFAKLNYFMNKQEYTISDNETIICSEGDRLYLNKVFFNDIVKEDVKINLAGYISDPKKDGDDKGIEIIINRKKFLKKFAISQNVFEIQINQNEKQLTHFFLKIKN